MELEDTPTEAMTVVVKDATNEDTFEVWDQNDEVKIDLENVNDEGDDDSIWKRSSYTLVTVTRSNHSTAATVSPPIRTEMSKAAAQ